ncbi:MAG: TolC family protein [Candidatus Omnitrophota bacterium]
MRKFLSAVLICLVSVVPGVRGAQEIARPSADAEGQIIRERLRVMRESRFKQMPYLDRMFIRTQISAREVEERNHFASPAKKSLQDILDHAARVHTKARASQERVNLEKRRILLALRNLFPEANFEFSDKDGKLSSTDAFGNPSGRAFVSRFYSFAFKQPLFRGGTLWNTLQQKKIDLETAKKDYEAVMRDLAKDVSIAYFDYDRTVEDCADHERVLEEMRKYIDMSDLKFKQEIISQIEYLNVQSLYSQMQYDYETSKQELELAKLELQKYLDLDVEDDIRIEPTYRLDDLLKPEESGDGGPKTPAPQEVRTASRGAESSQELKDFVDLAYQNRPELQVEASKLRSAQLEERIRFGELMPKADISLEFGKLGEQYQDIARHPGQRRNFKLALEVKWNFGGNTVQYSLENRDIAPSVSSYAQQVGSRTAANSLKVAMLDGLKAFVDTKDAEVARLDRVVELEKKEKEVIHDVKQAYFDYQKSKIQVKSSLQRTDYRKHVAVLSKHKLENNEIQISEYMDSEIALLRELTTLHKALAEYFNAKTKMNYSTGTQFFDVEDLTKIYE